MYLPTVSPTHKTKTPKTRENNIMQRHVFSMIGQARSGVAILRQHASSSSLLLRSQASASITHGNNSSNSFRLLLMQSPTSSTAAAAGHRRNYMSTTLELNTTPQRTPTYPSDRTKPEPLTVCFCSSLLLLSSLSFVLSVITFIFVCFLH